jgi:hypothetical protein
VRGKRSRGIGSQGLPSRWLRSLEIGASYGGDHGFDWTELYRLVVKGRLLVTAQTSPAHLVAKALSDIYQASKAREKRAAGLDPSVGHRVTKA